jgi:hypothetical protein
MSANRSPRLRTVALRNGSDRVGGVPVEILRFTTLPAERRTLLMEVHDLVEEIDYGTVVMVMHEGQVIQIETSEKIRLPRGSADREDRFGRG